MTLMDSIEKAMGQDEKVKFSDLIVGVVDRFIANEIVRLPIPYEHTQGWSYVLSFNLIIIHRGLFALPDAGRYNSALSLSVLALVWH
jgi:hypothetical protein